MNSKYLYGIILFSTVCQWSMAQEYAFRDSVLSPKVSALYLGDVDTIFYSDLIPKADYWFPQTDIPQLGLGFVGSPSRSITLELPNTSGFHLGLNANNVYRISNENFYYYPGETSITDLSYHQGQSQLDGVFKSLFSRTFKDNINVTFNYERYLNSGFYRNQEIRNTILGLGIRHISKGKKWQIQFEHFANTFQNQHNGGLTSDTLLKDDFDMRLDLPIALEVEESANSRDEERIIRLTNYYRLGSPDTVSASPVGLLFYHVLELNNRDFRFSDASSNEDEHSLFYTGFLGNEGTFLRDERGLRLSIEKRSLINELHVAFKSKNLKQQIDLGAAVKRHRLDLELKEPDITEFQALGHIFWNLTKGVELEGKAVLGTTESTFNYQIDGAIHLSPQSGIRLSGYIQSALRQPAFISQEAYSTLSAIPLWQNDWNQEFFNTLKAELKLIKWGLNLSLRQSTITDYIYFNQESLPQQESDAITLINARVNHNVKLGKWIFENDLTFQRLDNKDIFRGPEIFTRHNVYFQSPVFRGATIIKTGLRAEYQGMSEGMRFQPVLGQFIQSNSKLQDYFMLSYYLRFDVNRFNATVHLFNLTDFFNDTIRYQTSFYPYEQFTFRVGIHWLFLD